MIHRGPVALVVLISVASANAACSPRLVLGAIASDGGDGPPAADDSGAVLASDAGVVCTPSRDGDAATCSAPTVSCDPIRQTCTAGEKCIVADQETGYDWGMGRDAVCVAAGSGARDARCDATSDCAAGLECVFATMHDATTTWFSHEPSYLPMYASRCLPVCAIASGPRACALPTDACNPVQLWGFSGRDVNEVYGVCSPPPA